MTVLRGGNPFDNLPTGVKGLLVANGAAYMAQSLFPNFFFTYFALTPTKVLHSGWVWQLISYSFLHGNFFHLFFNMFALWMFGPHIESYWGTRAFLRFYFLCVLGAALTQTLVAPDSLVVGASGGLYGLLLAFGFLFPDAVIYLFFVFPLRAIQAVFVIAMITFISSLQAGGERIAHVADLGGIVTGLLYFKLPIWKMNIKSWIGRRSFRDPVPKFDVIYPHGRKDALTDEVDRILDKISSKGVDSLTKEEHETMKRYGEKKDW
jgi:membrane associated rhomboid family serine protease